MLLPTLNKLFSETCAQAGRLNKADLIVEFIVAFCERAILAGNDHKYYDPYLMIQLVSGAQGYCFMDPADFKESELDGIAGHSIVELLKSDTIPLYIKVALMDAAYYHLNQINGNSPKEIFSFQGTGSQKSISRASKIVELSGVEKGSNLVLIGAIADIIKIVKQKGGRIQVADFALAGTTVEQIEIVYDCHPLLDSADIVIITGNALKTNTMSDLLSKCQQLSKRVLVYSMSGANVAPMYLDYGASVVTSETFPYYWYANTISFMSVYKL